MAIPDKPLIVTGYDVDELTLAENRTLFGSDYVIDDFRQFLIDHVDHVQSWTEKEIGAIKRKELAEVRTQLFYALADAKAVKAEPPLVP